MKTFKLGWPAPQDWSPRPGSHAPAVANAFAAVEEWKKLLPEGILAPRHPGGFVLGGEAFWFPDDENVEIESRIAAILNLGDRWEMVFVVADGRVHMGEFLIKALKGEVPDLLHLKGLWPGGKAP